MTYSKLKLPTGVLSANGEALSEKLQTEMLHVEKAGIEAHGKIEAGRLQLLTEGVSAVKALIGVFAEHKRLETKRAEWEGRVKEAEMSVRKASIELDAARESNQTRRAELASLNATRDRLLRLFDDVMNEAASADFSVQQKAEQRQYLLALSELIVKLKA